MTVAKGTTSADGYRPAMRVATGLLAILLSVCLASPADADAASYYDRHARVVAKDANCLGTYKTSEKPNEVPDYYAGGSCKIGKLKLLIATFKGSGQQAEYKSTIKKLLRDYYPSGTYYWATDKGAMVFNKDFTRKAARIGKKRLGATISRITVA